MPSLSTAASPRDMLRRVGSGSGTAFAAGLADPGVSLPAIERRTAHLAHLLSQDAGGPLARLQAQAGSGLFIPCAARFSNYLTVAAWLAGYAAQGRYSDFKAASFLADVMAFPLPRGGRLAFGELESIHAAFERSYASRPGARGRRAGVWSSNPPADAGAVRVCVIRLGRARSS